MNNAIELLNSNGLELQNCVYYDESKLVIQIPFFDSVMNIDVITYDSLERIITIKLKYTTDNEVSNTQFNFNNSIPTINTLPKVQFKINVLQLLDLELNNYFYKSGKLNIVMKVKEL